jgi:hypothetical protein
MSEGAVEVALDGLVLFWVALVISSTVLHDF